MSVRSENGDGAGIERAAVVVPGHRRPGPIWGTGDGTMSSQPRMTKQGVRDLNNYGPKPAKPASAARPVANERQTGVSKPVEPKMADASPAGQSPPIEPS